MTVMKSLLQFTIVSSLALLSLPQARATDGACVDGRTARLSCKSDQLLTAYGCNEEFFVHCMKEKKVPLAERKTVDTFFMRGSEIIAIFRNGRVIQTIYAHEKTPVVREIARLSRRALAELTSHVNQVPASTLAEPTGPTCADGLTATYTVVREDGSVQDIAKWIACTESHLEDEGSTAVKTMLDRYNP